LTPAKSCGIDEPKLDAANIKWDDQPESYTSSAASYFPEALRAAGNFIGGAVQGAGDVGTRINAWLGVETEESAAAQRAKNLQQLQQNFGYDPRSGYSRAGTFAGGAAPAVGAANILARTVAPAVWAASPRAAKRFFGFCRARWFWPCVD